MCGTLAYCSNLNELASADADLRHTEVRLSACNVKCVKKRERERAKVMEMHSSLNSYRAITVIALAKHFHRNPV